MGTEEFLLLDVDGDLGLLFDAFVLFDDSFDSVTVSTYLISWKSGDMKNQAFLYLCRPD